MKQKRGQGLPMNAIVIAAIVLVVMVVLILIYTGSMGNFTGELGKCETKGGECVPKTSCDLAKGEKIISKTDCDDEEKYGKDHVCCIKLKGFE